MVQHETPNYGQEGAPNGGQREAQGAYWSKAHRSARDLTFVPGRAPRPWALIGPGPELGAGSGSGSSSFPALRAATIGFRLAIAAAPHCRARTALTGLVLHDRAAYDPAAREGLNGLGWGFGIRGVVEGSPADLARLNLGDELVTLGSEDLRNYRRDLAGSKSTFARTEAFTERLAAEVAEHDVRLGVMRAGRLLSIVLSSRTGCRVAFTLVPGRSPDAWTDGHYLAVTEGLEQRVGDDALAFAMAHELAHVALGHASGPQSPLAAIGIGAGRVRKQEDDADRLAVHLALAAGYDPAASAELFAILRRSNPLRIGPTHASFASRLERIHAEIARLAGKTATP